MSWGMSYGVLWWLLGALTLFPALLRQPVDWSLAAVSANYASLIGHLFLRCRPGADAAIPGLPLRLGTAA